MAARDRALANDVMSASWSTASTVQARAGHRIDWNHQLSTRGSWSILTTSRVRGAHAHADTARSRPGRDIGRAEAGHLAAGVRGVLRRLRALAPPGCLEAPGPRLHPGDAPVPHEETSLAGRHPDAAAVCTRTDADFLAGRARMCFATRLPSRLAPRISI